MTNLVQHQRLSAKPNLAPVVLESWMLGEHAVPTLLCMTFCTLASSWTYFVFRAGSEMTRRVMLVAVVAACSGLTMVASLGSETGQQIKLLAISMQSNLLNKGMVLFLETMESCCGTLGNVNVVVQKLQMAAIMDFLKESTNLHAL